MLLLPERRNLTSLPLKCCATQKRYRRKRRNRIFRMLGAGVELLNFCEHQLIFRTGCPQIPNQKNVLRRSFSYLRIVIPAKLKPSHIWFEILLCLNYQVGRTWPVLRSPTWSTNERLVQNSVWGNSWLDIGAETWVCVLAKVVGVDLVGIQKRV